MSPEERDRATMEVLVERVGRLERDQEDARKALDRFSTRVDQQFEALRSLITSSVASIKYVDEKTYDRDRVAFFDALKSLQADNEKSVAEVKAAAEKGIKEAKDDAERGIKIAWGIAVAFAVPFIGGLANIIMRAAS